MLLLIHMANVLPKKKKKRINKLSLIDGEGVTINEDDNLKKFFTLIYEIKNDEVCSKNKCTKNYDDGKDYSKNRKVQ